jgi:hypothetical protein
MRHVTRFTLAGAIALAAVPTITHAGSGQAVAACEAAVQNDYRFSNARESRAQEVGRDAYVVTGIVKTQDERDHRYSCRYEYGEVVSYNATEAAAAKSNNNTAAAVGAGVIGLAAIAAIAKHENDQHHRKNRDAYNRGDNYAFDDRNYLKRECEQEVRAHIDRDHGKVASIDLQAPYVHDRVMTGTGEVYFRNGGSRELRYSCNFDRSGEIYDGRYTYVGAGYPGHSGYSAYDYDGNRGRGSSEYERGFKDGKHGREFDSYRHPQDYKDGYRDGERARRYD